MRTTKKITVSAMAVALGALMLVLGSFTGVAELIFEVVASIISVFIFIEIGSPYTWLVWLATTLTVFFLPGGMNVGGIYFFVFGIYPILKAYVERLPRTFWWLIKISYINVIFAVMLLGARLITGVSMFTTDVWYLKAAVWVLVNVAFVAYDMFLTVMIRLYMVKYRKLFKKLLK